MSDVTITLESDSPETITRALRQIGIELDLEYPLFDQRDNEEGCARVIVQAHVP